MSLDHGMVTAPSSFEGRGLDQRQILLRADTGTSGGEYLFVKDRAFLDVVEQSTLPDSPWRIGHTER
jgi:hypothetical protein